MTWLPDWKLPRISVDIDSEDQDYQAFLWKVEVVQEGENLYRLYDIPFCDGLRWGDLIRAEPDCIGGREPSSIFFIEIVERAEHKFTHGKFLIGKPHRSFLLDAIMEAGGFWAEDTLMNFDVIISPNFDIDQWEKENRHIIETGGWAETEYDQWTNEKAASARRTYPDEIYERLANSTIRRTRTWVEHSNEWRSVFLHQNKVQQVQRSSRPIICIAKQHNKAEEPDNKDNTPHRKRA